MTALSDAMVCEWALTLRMATISEPRQMEPSDVVEARLSDDSTTWRLVVSSPESTTRD